MKVHHVKKARKDYPEQGIKRGDSYFWWKPRYGGIRRSKTYPSRQELTQSDFLCRVYDIEDEIAEGINIETRNPEEVENEIEGWISAITEEIEELKEECEEKLDNMPEQLQDTSETGMLLQERIEYLDEWINNLESVDTSIDREITEEELEERIEEILSELREYMYEGG